MLNAAIVENMRYNVAQLRVDQPVLAAPIAKGQVKVVGGVSDIATGRVNLL